MPNARRRAHSSNPEGSGGKKLKKWNHRLRHQGPQFPPPYERIPGSPCFRYNNRRFTLSIEAEEVAVFYAKYLMRKNRNRRQEKKLNENFFRDWTTTYMTDKERARIKDLSKCDFSRIIQYLQGESEKKAQDNREKSVEQRRRERMARQEEVKKHKTVFVDDRTEELSNYMVEPPGLFIGRGANARIGEVKRRITPADVTINCDANSIPNPPPPYQAWHRVVHDTSAMWLAKWDDPITRRPKYIQLDPGSKFKSDNDQLKYDTASKLKKKITGIRRKYEGDLKSKDLQERQHATAIYIIDNFALRAGNEKSKEEVDTVGCCSLRKEHIQLKGGYIIQFNFDGKDSIRYRNEAKVPKQVYENLKEFWEGARRGEEIFNEISTDSLNRYLNTLMPGLTAKVFRTFKATECFDVNMAKFMKELGRHPDDKEKKIVFDKANLEVAKLLNHRTLVKNDGRKKAIRKLERKIKNMEADLKKFKRGNNDDKKEGLQKNLRISKAELALKKSMDNYALQTSKVNYINPRVVLKWCKKKGVEHGKVYTKGQLKKFNWALGQSNAEPGRSFAEPE